MHALSPSAAPVSGYRGLVRTAVAPILWGATYLLFTETLPTGFPLWVGATRCVPAGLLLLWWAGPVVPPRAAWMRLWLLGLANIGVFSAAMFVAAARLEASLAATLVATQPLVASWLAWPLLGRRPTLSGLIGATGGALGVGWLVGGAGTAPDALGVAAGLVASASMATGTVLVRRWRDLGSPLHSAGWQLVLGGLVLVPAALAVEGVPPAPSPINLVGWAVLVTIGTSLAFAWWIDGAARLGERAAFLTLLSPVTAALLDVLFLDHPLSPTSSLAMALVLSAAATGLRDPLERPDENR